jgi:RNA recognition motif-containing protein
MKLFVGNLPFHVREAELRELFVAYGTPTTATVIVDNESLRSRGFGFVEFDDPAQGKAAIAGVNGMEIGGRALTVNEARPQGGGVSDRRGPRGGHGGGREGFERGGGGRRY